MKILFCSPTKLDRTLGAPKVIIELAEGLRLLGAECNLIGPSDVVPGLFDGRHDAARYASALRTYLHSHAAEYDVVDYDHEYLPYHRSEFPKDTLMVARSVLLHYHFAEIRFPLPRRPHEVAARLVRRVLSAKTDRENRDRANRTGLQADHFLTLNTHDRQTLIRHGYDPSKVTVVGLGFHPERFAEFSRFSTEMPQMTRVAFVGTFDYRKGCLDLPRIAGGIFSKHPAAELHLLGTAGLFQNKGEVLAHFPESMRDRVKVVPKFDPATLPELLGACSVGIFPSYIEGFGFGVLEMLAAGCPVIAYDAPGPPDVLPASALVPRGAAGAMAAAVSALLADPKKLSVERKAARRRASQFTWASAAKKTLRVYQEGRARIGAGEKIAHSIPV
jgi:glycosyltransferase involved in cell wall biosynthesis